MTTEAPPLLRTPLHAFHLAHRAHLVPFGGWEMPLYYESILDEHAAVRDSAGLFDVSHMGILTVRGTSATALLARRTTANVAKIAPGQVRYTFLLGMDGRIFDDLLVTRLDPGGEATPSYLVVPNAGTAPAVYDLLRQHRRPDTVVVRHNGAIAILAVQGPKAPEILESQFGWRISEIPFYRSRLLGARPSTEGPTDAATPGDLIRDLETGVLVSRTGYTGEAGAELFVRAERAVEFADRLVAAGVRPTGLGARDSLRLEKGYLLSGVDFHLDRTPFEAAQERFVELDHPFVGRDALLAQQKAGVPARLAGLSTSEPSAIPRHGSPVLHDGKVIAAVTSGGLSPTLHHGIALAYLPAPLGTVGTALEIDLRGRKVPAVVTKLPFVPNRPIAS
ncbi:MAG: glycine cleavage system aminomethyltransferase GcvT [Thermoplasmata archaeon]|nr:glycine cleavage system aminomethyltransferase GcvT [Thermoplasmata archaeon]